MLISSLEPCQHPGALGQRFLIDALKSNQKENLKNSWHYILALSSARRCLFNWLSTFIDNMADVKLGKYVKTFAQFFLSAKCFRAPVASECVKASGIGRPKQLFIQKIIPHFWNVENVKSLGLHRNWRSFTHQWQKPEFMPCLENLYGPFYSGRAWIWVSERELLGPC